MGTVGKHWTLSSEVLAHRQSMRDTEDITRKVSKAMKAHWMNPTSKLNSITTRNKLSRNTRRAMATPEVKAKLVARPHREPWNKGLTKEVDNRVARYGQTLSSFLKANPRESPTKGKHPYRSPEAAEKQSLTFRKRYAAGLIRRAEPKYRRMAFLKKDGTTVWLRSTWEQIFASVLDTIGAEWFYEPKRFVLSNYHVYTPDFLVFYPEIFQPVFGCQYEFVEVKGYKTPQFVRKFKEFKEMYPEVPIRIVEEDIMNELLLSNKYCKAPNTLSPKQLLQYEIMNAHLRFEAKSLGYAPTGKGK